MEKNNRDLILLLGSNISPEKNLQLAREEIGLRFPIVSISSIWESKPVGSNSELNFLNQALIITTSASLDSLKYQVFREIEASLGRIRSEDKNAPRTIDIDIIVEADQVVDDKLWQQAFVAVPVSQLIHSLKHPELNISLDQFAETLKQKSWIREVPAFVP